MAKSSITADEIVELWRALVNEHTQLIALDKLRNSVYYDTHEVQFPRAWREQEEVHSGIAYAYIAQVKGVLSTWPTLSVVPPGIGNQARRQSTAMEDALNTMLPALSHNSRVWERIKEDVLRLGRGVGKVLWLPQHWTLPDLPADLDEETAKLYSDAVIEAKREQGPPIIWLHVPATSVLRDGAGVYLEYRVRRVRDLLRKYKLPKLRAFYNKSSLRSASDTVEWLEYWDSEQMVYVVNPSAGDPEVALQEKHDYGKPPYVYITGEASSSEEPHLRDRGLLDAVLQLILRLDRTLSQKATAVRRWAWSPPVYQRQYRPSLGEDGSPQGPEIDLSGDKLITIWHDERFEWMPAPQENQGIDAYLGMLLRFIDRLTIPSVVAGVTPSDVTAGYAINSLIQAATQRFQEVRSALEMGYADTARHILDIIEEQIKRDIYVWRDAEEGGEYLRLGPGQIKGWRNLKANQKIELPFDETAALQRANMAQKFFDDNTIREQYLRDEAPERSADRIRIQEFWQHPAVKSALMEEGLRRGRVQLRELDERSTPELTPENAPPALAMALAQASGSSPAMPPPGAERRMATQSPQGRVMGESRRPGGVPAEQRETFGV